MTWALIGFVVGVIVGVRCTLRVIRANRQVDELLGGGGRQ